MKAVVFAVLFGLSSVASAACPGYLWECRDKYSPEVPTIEDQKPPVDRIPVAGNWWQCPGQDCDYYLKPEIEQVAAFSWNDNPRDKICDGDYWNCEDD